MSFPITIRIYGTNTQPTASVATKSDLDTASTGGSPTVWYKEFSVGAINASFVLEGENKVDISRRMRSKNQLRPAFEVKVDPISLPATATNLQTFYGSTVFSKKYHYLWFNSYTLPDSGCANTQCLNVAVENVDIQTNYEQGAKEIVITLKKGYSE